MGPLRQARSGARASALDVSILALTAVAAFSPVFRNQFVNWDDPTVLVDNPHLGGPGVVPWAFTTTLIGHYQPLAWLSWSAAKSLFGLSPAAFHALSLAGHIANGLLVYAVTLRLADAALLRPRQRRAAAATAAFLFLLHPIQVEAAAWASAFPYVLSLAALLLAFLAYLNDRLFTSIACYAVSLLARAIALSFPAVLVLADVYPLERLRRPNVRRLVLEKIPFIVLAAVATMAEAHAREVATLQEIGVGARLTLFMTAPFIYLGRMLLPARLSPLDPLPISPALDVVPLLVGVAGLAGITVAAWALRRQWPALGAGWIAYVLLLAPVAGLVPSGLQSTADRYVYLPGVAIAIVIGIAVAKLNFTTEDAEDAEEESRQRRRRISARQLMFPSGKGAALALTMLVLLAALGLQTRRQTEYWHDSITLWTRAADLDPRNDVATYNLAIALAEAGREDEAAARYEQTLQLVPDQELARRNLTALQGAHAEREADRLATAGRMDEAAIQYARALSLDGSRLHARAGRGVILTRRGRFEEAAAELRIAFDGHVQDPEVPNALAFALVQTGRAGDAVDVLKRAVAEHPDNVNIAHNLARLLATAPDVHVRDGDLALRLALEVRDRTAGRDPRALDTLAAAYAAVGRPDKARETASQAAALARQLGDAEAADEIAARARTYRR